MKTFKEFMSESNGFTAIKKGQNKAGKWFALAKEGNIYTVYARGGNYDGSVPGGIRYAWRTANYDRKNPSGHYDNLEDATKFYEKVLKGKRK
jgi:hypothetical protein